MYIKKNIPNAAARNLDAFVVRTVASVPFRTLLHAPLMTLLRFDVSLLLPPPPLPKLCVLLLFIDVESADDVIDKFRVGDIDVANVFTPCQHGIVLPIVFVFIDRMANGCATVIGDDTVVGSGDDNLRGDFDVMRTLTGIELWNEGTFSFNELRDMYLKKRIECGS